MIYSRDVASPAKAPGCGCIDGCRPDSLNCSCLNRQKNWTRRFPQVNRSFKGGFAYDAKGRLILPEEVPIVECNVSSLTRLGLWFLSSAYDDCL